MNKVSDMPPHEIRRHLSEQVRLAHRKYNALDDNASRLEEGRKIVMADLKNDLIEAGHAKSLARAEDLVLISEKYRDYLRRMHDARREANDAKADWAAIERDYWNAVSDDASERQQMRMSRG